MFQIDVANETVHGATSILELSDFSKVHDALSFHQRANLNNSICALNAQSIA